MCSAPPPLLPLSLLPLCWETPLPTASMAACPMDGLSLIGALCRRDCTAMRGRTNTGEGVALGIDFRFRKFDVMNYLRYYLVFTFALLYITNSCSIYIWCMPDTIIIQESLIQSNTKATIIIMMHNSCVYKSTSRIYIIRVYYTIIYVATCCKHSNRYKHDVCMHNKFS